MIDETSYEISLKAIELKKNEVKKVEKQYKNHVQSKNLFAIPALASIFALSYLGLRTFLSHKLGVNVGDLFGYEKEIISTIDSVAGITTFIGLFGSLPATLCCKLDEKESKRILDCKKKELEDLLNK
ncbi:MAG: hypothetical protein KKB39_02940 [Nanoarchaeota archaeon]|nr:hypothetical protein [Nanoarchaeota archaeon]